MRAIVVVTLVVASIAYTEATQQVVQEQNDTATVVHVRQTRSTSNLDDGVGSQEVAEHLGKYIMFHMFSALGMENACKDIAGLDHKQLSSTRVSDMNMCLLKGKDKVINRLDQGVEFTETSIIYYTLLDLAADEPNRGSLLLKELDYSGPKLGLTWFKSRKGDIRKKLPRNKEFNELYEKHIVHPCERIVGDYTESDDDSLAHLYAKIAHRACSKLVLNKNKLRVFPEVVANEHHIVHLGNEPFRFRLPNTVTEETQ